MITVLPIRPELETFLEVGAQRSYPSKSPIKFLYVGRFAKEKNVPLLLNAWAKLGIDSSVAELRLLGEGPENDSIVYYDLKKNKLIHFYIQYDNFIFMDHLED